MQDITKKKQILLLRLAKPFAVTIATNMAGRGTDIQLGGNLDEQKNKEKNI